MTEDEKLADEFCLLFSELEEDLNNMEPLDDFVANPLNEVATFFDRDDHYEGSTIECHNTFSFKGVRIA